MMMSSSLVPPLSTCSRTKDHCIYFVGLARETSLGGRLGKLGRQFEIAGSATAATRKHRNDEEIPFDEYDDDNDNDHKVPFEAYVMERLTANSTWEEDQPFVSIGYKWVFSSKRHCDWHYVVVAHEEYPDCSLHLCLEDLVKENEGRGSGFFDVEENRGHEICSRVLHRWSNTSSQGGTKSKNQQAWEIAALQQKQQEKSTIGKGGVQQKQQQASSSSLAWLVQADNHNDDDDEMVKNACSFQQGNNGYPMMMCSGCTAGAQGEMAETLYSLFNFSGVDHTTRIIPTTASSA